jgi:V8-like Glu-specific endopeptidase
MSAATAVVAVVACLGAAVAPSAASTAVASRQSRTSGVAIAGANVYLWSVHRSEDDGSGCTLSFVVSSVTTGQQGALTAGHCVGTLDGGPSYAVHQTRNVRADTTDPGVQLGAVSEGQYRFGKQGDSAFMGLAEGRTARAAVYVGGPRSHRSIPVAGLTQAKQGLTVCYSGAVTGEHCGFRVVGRPAVISFKYGGRNYRIRHEWRATGVTCTSRAGDSGSPVYVKRRGAAYAVGVLSGGQQHAGHCPFYFSPVSVALRHLDVQLVTAS